MALIRPAPYLARDVRYKGGPQTHHPLSGEVEEVALIRPAPYLARDGSCACVLPEAEAADYVGGEDKPLPYGFFGIGR